MSSLASSLSYNVGFQFLARMGSFTLNMYLLRVVDTDVLGIVNVRLALLYNTILFLTREPFRKGNLKQGTLEQFVNAIWLSPIVCCIISLALTSLWSFAVSSGESSFPLSVILCFSLSAVIESLSEPFIIISLRCSLTRFFATAQALQILLQKVLAVVLIYLSSSPDHLFVLAVAQVFSSLLFSAINIGSIFWLSQRQTSELSEFKGIRSFFPSIKAGFDMRGVKSALALTWHSVLKQLLTDGSSFIMTFTNLLSLQSQAVYDAVEKLGSLVVRIVLSPVEEACFAHFSNEIRTQGSSKILSTKFSNMVHAMVTLGAVVCCFGVPFSPLAVTVYGGSLLADNGGATILSIYCVYMVVLALNGLTEGFAMASMDDGQVYSHSGFLSLVAGLNVVLSVVLCSWLGASGFIIANCINMSIRVVYSWRRVREFLGVNSPPLSQLLPSFSVVAALIVAFAFSMGSLKLFGEDEGRANALAHVSLGGILFGFVVFHIATNDFVFSSFLDSYLKSKQQ